MIHFVSFFVILLLSLVVQNVIKNTELTIFFTSKLSICIQISLYNFTNSALICHNFAADSGSDAFFDGVATFESLKFYFIFYA